MSSGSFFAVVGLAALLAAAPASSTEMLPLSHVKPGMQGVGRTVFEGSKVEEFQVTILGTFENVGPKQNMILARLEGGPLEKTGVPAGISGSPVYIDGKLVGAVAFGFPFAKETIAGITPIGEMIEATRTQTARAASTRLLPTRPMGASSLRGPLDRDSLIASLKRPLAGVLPTSAAPSLLPRGLAGAPVDPLAVPLVFSGIDSRTFEWARGVFGGLGFTPVMGTTRSSPTVEAVPDLVPGSAVGLTLVEGDMDVSATGTVTHVDGDRIWAFGHSFFNLGPTQFPMRKVYVYSMFPSLYQSWKVATPVGPAVGTIEQDRMTAISGRLGKTPRMIPISVKVTTSRGQDRQYTFRMVDDEMMSPLLAYVSLLSVLQANERAFGTSTIGLEADLQLSDGRTIEVEDVFADAEAASNASLLLAAPLAYLLSNGFEPVTIESLNVAVTSHETIQSATLERAWIERAGRVRPGAEVSVNLLLRTYRGDALRETVSMKLPGNARPGTYTLLIADAPTLTAVEQREMAQAFLPKDLDQLIRAINGLRRNNHLYFRLLQPENGAIVAGEFLQSLPPSILSVMGTAQGDGVVPIRTAAVWEHDLHTAYATTGSRSLTLHIER
jgi:hypothetical protein